MHSQKRNGYVAQLYRASDYGSEGYRLESYRGHINKCYLIVIQLNSILLLSYRTTFAQHKFSDQVKKLWGVDKNISFAKKTNADKWI